jgi:hypothetical protein
MHVGVGDQSTEQVSASDLRQERFLDESIGREMRSRLRPGSGTTDELEIQRAQRHQSATPTGRQAIESRDLEKRAMASLYQLTSSCHHPVLPHRLQRVKFCYQKVRNALAQSIGDRRREFHQDGCWAWCTGDKELGLLASGRRTGRSVRQDILGQLQVSNISAGLLDDTLSADGLIEMSPERPFANNEVAGQVPTMAGEIGERVVGCPELDVGWQLKVRVLARHEPPKKACGPEILEEVGQIPKRPAVGVLRESFEVEGERASK